jgi:hypothetical protein
MFERFRTMFAPPQSERSHYAIMSTPLTDVCPIPYHPELIDELRETHAQLTNQLRAVIASYRNDDHVGCVTRLEHFDSELRAYLIKEGVRFEGYMSFALLGNPPALQLMHNLRVRLRQLARKVHEFALRTRTGMLQPEAYHRFGRDLNRLADSFSLCLLTQREQLFPLYRPVGAAQIAEPADKHRSAA